MCIENGFGVLSSIPFFKTCIHCFSPVTFSSGWEYLCFVAFHRNGGINTGGGNGMSGKSTKFQITSDLILNSGPLSSNAPPAAHPLSGSQRPNFSFQLSSPCASPVQVLSADFPLSFSQLLQTHTKDEERDITMYETVSRGSYSK